MARYRAILILAAVLMTAGLHAKDPPNPEVVKAASIFRIAQFVRWPDFEIGGEVNICTLDAPVLHERLLPLEKVSKSRYQFKVSKIDAKSDVSQCRILYLNDYEDDKKNALLASVKDLSILTISSDRGFAKDIGVLEFILTDDALIKISINVSHVRRAGLTIDSRVLELARLVGIEP